MVIAVALERFVIANAVLVLLLMLVIAGEVLPKRSQIGLATVFVLFVTSTTCMPCVLAAYSPLPWRATTTTLFLDGLAGSPGRSGAGAAPHRTVSGALADAITCMRPDAALRKAR